MEYESEFDRLVDAAFEREQRQNPEYFASLSQKTKKIIYRDTRYNIDFLYTAFVLDDEKIIQDYALWLYQLMDSVLTDYTAEQSRQYVIRHLEAIRQSIPETVSAEKQIKLQKLVECAEEHIAADVNAKNETKQSQYETEIQEYMARLFQKNTRKTVQLVREFSARGIPLSDVYVEILAESMRRIGELWHTAQITVDMEHYCTSVTQMAMVQMYPELFEGERKNKTILCACPGTELHEMGARMVADLFENDGWDSIYLGAAVPEDAMIASVEENQPDLIALSVTMPQHLIDCSVLVERLKKEFPHIPIAVGGHAFDSTNEIWKRWNVDLYTSDARTLLAQADKIC